MSEHVYKIVELTGTSSHSSDEAIRNAVARASSSIRQLRWFEVLDTRGEIENGQVTRWQVTLKVGFTLEA